MSAIRVGSPGINVWIARIALPLFMAGCGGQLAVSTTEGITTKGIDSNLLVVQPTHLKLPTKLVSELEVVDGQSRIMCPFPFRNDTGETRQVELGGTGCACYGVFHEGRKLATGDRIEIAPGQEIEFVIQADAVLNEQYKEYQSWFQEQYAGEWHKSPLECGVRIVSDVKVDPPLQAFLLKPGDKSGPRTVTITRCSRHPEVLATAPQLQEVPAEVTISSLAATGEPEEFEPGLWQRQWQAVLEAKLLGTTDVDASPATLRVWFAESPESSSAGATFQTSVRLDLPIRYPRSVQFGKLERNQSRTRKIFISSSDREFELTLPEAANASAASDMRVSVPAAVGAVKHWVEITIQPRTSGIWSEPVILRTNLPELPELKIQVSAIVVEPTQPMPTPGE